jgi:opacity protein-like surface antigen
VSIRRMLVAAAAACVLVGALAAPATASPPTKFPRNQASFVLSGTCQGFDIRVDQDSRQGTSRDLGNGLITTSGAITGTVTRLNPDGSDGASVSMNFSGPGVIDTVNNVVYARGPWLISNFDDPATPAFEGFMYLVHGRTVFNTFPDTNGVELVSSTAPVRDVCAELA